MKSRPTAVDDLSPKGETVQIILKKGGKPVSGIYSDDTREVRSPDLNTKRNDEATRSNQ